MSEAVSRLMSRPGVLPALITAFGIFVFLILEQLISGALSSIYAVSVEFSGQADRDDFFAYVWSTVLNGSLTGALPLAVGVFLCFWQVAPIAPTLRLAHVVTRAILAAVIGAFLVWLVTLVVAWAPQIWTWLTLAYFPGGLGGDPGFLAIDALQFLIARLPLVVLGAVFLWGWLQRHPLDYQVRGTLDEV